jgi:hypothetical protein
MVCVAIGPPCKGDDAGSTWKIQKIHPEAAAHFFSDPAAVR